MVPPPNGGYALQPAPDQANPIQPCGIDHPNGTNISPFHLLSCGHLVVSTSSWKCALNCLHTTLPTAGPISSRSRTQDMDYLYCEMCAGIPISSYTIASFENKQRHALSLTRPVIAFYGGYTEKDIDFATSLLARVSGPWDSPLTTHRLLCKHVVACDPARPCASNCDPKTQCDPLGRWYRQGDAILCRECVYRAEMVYSRYLSVAGGGARDAVEQYGLLAPVTQAAPTLHDESASDLPVVLYNDKGATQDVHSPGGGLPSTMTSSNTPTAAVSVADSPQDTASFTTGDFATDPMLTNGYMHEEDYKYNHGHNYLPVHQ